MVGHFNGRHKAWDSMKNGRGKAMWRWVRKWNLTVNGTEK